MDRCALFYLQEVLQDAQDKQFFEELLPTGKNLSIATSKSTEEVEMRTSLFLFWKAPRSFTIEGLAGITIEKNCEPFLFVQLLIESLKFEPSQNKKNKDYLLTRLDRLCGTLNASTRQHTF